MSTMRKVALLLLALMLFAWLIPAQQPAEGQLIPWEDWSNFWWNVQVEPVGNPTATVRPLGQHEFRFKFWNGGVVQGDSNVPLRYYLKIVEVDDEGWTASVSPTYIPLDQDDIGNASVFVNAGAQPSYIVNITCQVEMHVKLTDFVKYGNVTFQVRSEPYRFLEVNIDNPVFEGQQESTYTMPINITNNGNYEDSYTVSVTYAPSNWLYSVSESQVHLFPGQTATVHFTFHIPHERFYIQYENYIMLVRVQSVSDPSARITRPVVVSLSGFHMTMGQVAAAASTLPSIILLVVIGSALAYTSNPCRQIPKPWKEPQEKKALADMERARARREKRLMEEEWKSAYYFCQAERERHRHLRDLAAKRNRKQADLRDKILDEWRNAWIPPHREWREQQRRIQEEYQSEKKRLLATWQKMNRSIEQANAEMGTAIAPIPKPAFPAPPSLPEPGKLPQPRIPEYKVDIGRMQLVEPDPQLVTKIMAPLRRAAHVGKLEAEKIRRLGTNRRKKLRLAMQSLEKKMEASMERAQRQISLERKKRQHQKKMLEQRYKQESQTKQQMLERQRRRKELRKRLREQREKEE
ncbi:MAG: hypothetical protein PHU95_00535 [Candidatus Thermoplasmatota archaeon]|nr:hypothetical protein [Candidatus Thermoplasmatota archaeon]